MKHALIATTLLAALPAAAEPETYSVDSRHTFPAFEVRHMGISLQRGRFNKTSGKIMLDAAAGKGSLDITIDAASIDTGLEGLEKVLRSDEFFDVEKYPTLTFKSANVAFDGERVKSASGDLTMHGVTKPVTLNAESFSCTTHPRANKKVCGAELVARINRSEWNMKYGIPGVADEVVLRINVEAMKD